ncbi:hypothetical protein GCM10009119_04360 [Algoriphagus jejuensis]|uniref:SnoaL-like domain-containing protein n=1 Tax=Algoriphagus jejuensis TaxID=419934 RepID=A0ABN1MWA8_9BACT
MKIAQKSLVLVLVMVLTIMSTKAQEVTLDFNNAASILQLTQQYVGALQAGDVSKMDAALAQNAMIYGLGGALDSLTKAQHKEYYTTSTTNYTHTITGELYLPVKVTNNWNEGEWVLAWGTNTLTDKATGKTITVPYHTASLIENGKIIRVHYWYDMLNVLQSQGFQITPAAN